MVIAANGGWNVPVVLTVKGVKVVITIPELTLLLMIACSNPVQTSYCLHDSEDPCKLVKDALAIVGSAMSCALVEDALAIV